MSEKKIYIQPPHIPNTNILTELGDDWKVILIELILQKRLTIERISRIFFRDEATTRQVISSMVRAGIIEEKKENLYVLNEYIEPLLVRIFKKEELL